MRLHQLQELGLQIMFCSPEQAETCRAAGVPSGAVILHMESGLGQASGLHVGDVVAAINGQEISSEDELRRVLRAVGPGRSKWVIRRGNVTVNVEIDCPMCKIT